MAPVFEKLNELDHIRHQNDAIIIGLEILIFNLLGQRLNLRQIAADPELIGAILGDMNNLRRNPREFDEAISLEPGTLDDQPITTDEELVAAAYAEASSASAQGENEVANPNRRSSVVRDFNRSPNSPKPKHP